MCHDGMRRNGTFTFVLELKLQNFLTIFQSLIKLGSLLVCSFFSWRTWPSMRVVTMHIYHNGIPRNGSWLVAGTPDTAAKEPSGLGLILAGDTLGPCGTEERPHCRLSLAC
jgi:hypothetical protein